MGKWSDGRVDRGGNGQASMPDHFLQRKAQVGTPPRFQVSPHDGTCFYSSYVHRLGGSDGFISRGIHHAAPVVALTEIETRGRPYRSIVKGLKKTGLVQPQNVRRGTDSTPPDRKLTIEDEKTEGSGP